MTTPSSSPQTQKWRTTPNYHLTPPKRPQYLRRSRPKTLWIPSPQHPTKDPFPTPLPLSHPATNPFNFSITQPHQPLSPTSSTPHQTTPTTTPDCPLLHQNPLHHPHLHPDPEDPDSFPPTALEKTLTSQTDPDSDDSLPFPHDTTVSLTPHTLPPTPTLTLQHLSLPAY